MFLSKETIRIRTLKGGKEREILLEPQVIEAIKSIPRALHIPFVFHHNGRPYAKTTLWKILRSAQDRTGFEGVTLNEFGQHSAASSYLRRGASTRMVQYLLGHTDIRTTERYTHIQVKDQERVRRK